MALITWIAIAGVCLLVVFLGLWAISRIFPSDRTTTHQPNPGQSPLTGPVHTPE